MRECRLQECRNAGIGLLTGYDKDGSCVNDKNLVGLLLIF